LRIQLDNPALMADLTEFLRRCECRVERISPRLLRVQLRQPVTVDAALSRVRDGACFRCGAAIERALAGLGSTTCQDCRDRMRATNGDSHRPPDHSWARMEVGAFLRVWTLRHPEAPARLLA
jgi:hypothetical protein